jgi:hypothetical protein
MKFRPGDWLRWSTPTSVKEGEVIAASGPSMVVRWLSGEEQTFPIYDIYVQSHVGVGDRMVRIERPKEASRIERDRARGVMSVRRAAASLGVSPKRVRAMIRSGQLKGVQKEGKWVSVEL